MADCYLEFLCCDWSVLVRVQWCRETYTLKPELLGREMQLPNHSPLFVCKLVKESSKICAWNIWTSATILVTVAVVMCRWTFPSRAPECM